MSFPLVILNGALRKMLPYAYERRGVKNPREYSALITDCYLPKVSTQ